MACRWRIDGWMSIGSTGIAGEEVDDVEHLEQADEVLVVGPVADPSPAVGREDVGRAGHRAEGDAVTADEQVVVRVRGMQRERGGRGRDALEDEGTVEVDALRARVDRRAGGDAAGRATPARGSPCRSPRAPAARRGGSTPARRPRGPRSGDRGGAAGSRRAAPATDCGGRSHGRPGGGAPARPPSAADRRSSSAHPSERSNQVVLSCV